VKQRTLSILGIYGGVIFTVLVMGFPLYWMVKTSVEPPTRLFSPPYDYFPTVFSLENYRLLLFETYFPTFLKNSLIVGFFCTFLTAVVSSLAGYGLTRFDFGGKKLIARGTLFSYMFPELMLGIPLYIIFDRLGLRNSYVGLILAHASIGIPLGTWTMWQYFQIVPLSLEEAAWVSGASRLRTLREVVLPIAAPGLITVSTFAFAFSWNDYTYAKIFQDDITMFTITTGINSFVERTAVHWGLIQAGATLITIPTLAIIVFLQKQLLESMARGGLK
jgi:multiple sugar transport system permease protein